MANSGWYFGADSKLAVKNILEMKKAFMTGKQLEAQSKFLLEQIKQSVVTKLLDDKFSQRDPRATNRGFGFSINQIAAAVNTRTLRDKLSLVGGVGEITRLDAADPLLKLKNPPRALTPEVRLWRILEYGTIKKGYEITAKNISKAPKGGAKTKGTKSSFASSKEKKMRAKTATSQIPQLRFFWKKANVPFRGPSVIHPGQVGRGVWVAVLAYEVKQVYGKGMANEMRKIVTQYSGR